jgi:adenylate kinase family enzyme
MERIAIVGTSASGKTTLAKALSRALQVPHIELDAINWLPDWKERGHEDFREKVAGAIRGERWIVDGNYSRVQDLVLARSTAVVWLNLPFRLVFFRMLRRIFRRSLTREELWQGNRETLLRHFFTRKSMLLWVVKTYGKNKRKYHRLFGNPDLAQVRKIELKSPREVAAFLEGCRPAPSAPGEIPDTAIRTAQAH